MKFLQRINSLNIWDMNIPLTYIILAEMYVFKYFEAISNSHLDTNSGFVFIQPDSEFKEQKEKSYWSLSHQEHHHTCPLFVLRNVYC